MDRREFYREILELFYVWHSVKEQHQLCSLCIEGKTVRRRGVLDELAILHHIAGVSEQPIAFMEVPSTEKGDVWGSPTLVEPDQFPSLQRNSAYKKLLTFSVRHLPVLSLSEAIDALQRGLSRLPIRNLEMDEGTPPIVQTQVKDALHKKLNISIERISARNTVLQLGLEPTEAEKRPFLALDPSDPGQVDEHGRAADGGNFLGVKVRPRPALPRGTSSKR